MTSRRKSTSQDKQSNLGAEVVSLKKLAAQRRAMMVHSKYSQQYSVANSAADLSKLNLHSQLGYTPKVN